jgi:hypothetical protein
MEILNGQRIEEMARGAVQGARRKNRAADFSNLNRS